MRNLANRTASSESLGRTPKIKSIPSVARRLPALRRQYRQSSLAPFTEILVGDVCNLSRLLHGSVISNEAVYFFENTHLNSSSVIWG